jgi:hypothetical protein
VPWLAFGAGLVGFFLWIRRPLRPSKLPRRPATALTPGRRERKQVADSDSDQARPS